MPYLISAKQLLERQQYATTLVIDCRYDLLATGHGRIRYLQAHIPGAVYISLDDDLCGPLSEHGGRHPLPSLEAMTGVFSRLGIERGKTEVTIYDDERSCYAARVWWMLRYLGHERVQVVDGGFQSWIESGGTTTREETRATPARFKPDVQHQLLATADDVRTKQSSILMDCRAAERFRGEEENIDPVAGHIPGAVNLPWMKLVSEDGRLLSADVLRGLLDGVDERSIMYCGSGVTACVNILAAAQCGIGTPRLYAGGWSDWITWPGNEIATNRSNEHGGRMK